LNNKYYEEPKKAQLALIQPLQNDQENFVNEFQRELRTGAEIHDSNLYHRSAVGTIWPFSGISSQTCCLMPTS
jgi:hypothetical protein